MGDIASQITSLAIVCSTVNSCTYQRKHQSSASLAFVRGIHWRPVNSPHKWPVTPKIFPFDDVIMVTRAKDINYVYISHTKNMCYGAFNEYFCFACVKTLLNKQRRHNADVIFINRNISTHSVPLFETQRAQVDVGAFGMEPKVMGLHLECFYTTRKKILVAQMDNNWRASLSNVNYMSLSPE